MALIDQQALVHHAIDLGVNLIDTTKQYGESESILGRCLRGIPRNQYFLSTKWAPRIGGNVWHCDLKKSYCNGFNGDVFHGYSQSALNSYQWYLLQQSKLVLQSVWWL